MSHPSDLRGKALNMILLPIQHIFGNKKRERTVLYAHLLNMRVEPLLDLLPDEVGGRLGASVVDMRASSLAKYLQNKAARDVVVIKHLALG